MTDTRLTQWTQTRQMLTDLLVWLDDTRRWCEDPGAGMEPQDEEARHAAAAFESGASTTDSAAVAVPGLERDAAPVTQRPRTDWSTVLAELTALRHEVNLQTRSVCQDRELTAQVVEQLKEASVQVERLQREEVSRRDAAALEASRTTANLLMDLHDSLSRAAREGHDFSGSCSAALRTWSEQAASIPVASPTASPTAGSATSSPAAREPAGAPAPASGDSPIESMRGLAHRAGKRLRIIARQGASKLHRWLQPLVLEPGIPSSQGVAGMQAPVGSAFDSPEFRRRFQNDATRLASRVEAVGEGYALNLQRLERVLAEHGIEPIECIGKPIDSSLMEVVQTVSDSTGPSGCVVAEVRRGYRRNGQVCRLAQVVVNRREPGE
ncbi:MAG: nucleotide exchange factor GrpE [Planctomycetes bacterium]|nr:nucleotide exchange factor GrpE [Planctomycetota bacterium]